ncbi:GatB/YqeY domain-containing protein [uncultured Marinococcus sp.]|uniref:GatB/YqeY domain-containing protein n=1 Tax=uncultured Marinococcus sp. TaxID=487012 RepID=UPI0026329B44|nr:GatB/YqeY domain-containing protein [uncultured Marinococcus sp.]
MELMDRLSSDMKSAMKNKEKQRLNVIRGLRASMQNEAIKLNKELDESEATAVLNREMKQRKDSLHEFESAGREDLAEQTRFEMDVISEYLPAPLSNEELESIVKETIQEENASSMKDMGTVMSAVMPKISGKADGSQVNQLVKKHLSS